ncbi:hypothetical protein [Vulgatibacter sp.]|uniref:hypothetical protein n=1 Tax=Vulgatibacter sp. TaxID=1971226 RepID=UPI00356B5E9A
MSDEHEHELLRPLRGRFALAEDEGFRVVFRRADGALAAGLAWAATALVLGITLATLLQEGASNPVAWMIAGLVDFTLIYVAHALRRGLSRGGISVDGSERRIFLPEGAEIVFERLRCVSVRPAGARAELVVVHDTGVFGFGERPAAEVEVAAQAVARVTELARVPWADAGAAAVQGT